MAASQYGVVAAGVGTTVIKASAGSLAKIVATAAGTGSGNVTVYDNATTGAGNILCAFNATQAIGAIFPVDGIAKNGITVVNIALGPALTVYYD